MKGKKMALAATSAIAVLIVSAAALSMGMRDGGLGSGGRGSGGHAGMMGMKTGMMGGDMLGLGIFEKALDNPQLVAEIGLSEAQLTRIQNVITDQRKASIAAHAELQTLMVDLDNLMRQDSASLTSIEAKIDDIGLKQTAIHKNSVRTTFEIKKILTKEQIDKIKEIAAEKMKERRKDRDGKRGEGNERKGKGGMKGGGSPYND
ncbi:MAG TPA: hypothetical protein PKH33_07775 [bacterium]|nr:hypothetical protein [bacterium]